jgi:flagellar FliL protein
MSDAAKPAASAGGNKKLIIIVAAAVLLSVTVAVGITLALTHGHGEKSASVAEHDGKEAADGGDAATGADGEGGATPTYVSLEPPFVVNFQDQKKHTKFLKAEISVVATNPKAQEALTLHMPAVRNSLVLLLSRQVFEELSTNEGKEKLRADALEAVREVITKQTSAKNAQGVKDLYFSALVMQ